jgi:hypothetical protein
MLYPSAHEVNLRRACSGSTIAEKQLQLADEARRAFIHDPTSLLALTNYRTHWDALRMAAHESPWETSEDDPLGFAWGNASLVEEETNVVYVECTEFEQVNLNACEVLSLLQGQLEGVVSSGKTPVTLADVDEQVVNRVFVLAENTVRVLGEWINLPAQVSEATPVCCPVIWSCIHEAFGFPVLSTRDFVDPRSRVDVCRRADDTILRTLSVPTPPRHALDGVRLLGRARSMDCLRNNLPPVVDLLSKRRETLESAHQLALLLVEVSTDNEGQVILDRICFLQRELGVEQKSTPLNWDRVLKEVHAS